MLSPKALSLRLMVCSLGSERSAVRRKESAWGISFSKRPVNMSARLAI